MINKLFTTSEYDERIFIINNDDAYTVKDIKYLVSAKIEQILTASNNAVICTDNNFSFIVNFFAAIFAQKEIYLITEPQKIKSLRIDHFVMKNDFSQLKNMYDFKPIDLDKVIINFYTSGSTNEPKLIKKSLFNLYIEGKDIAKEFNFNNTNNFYVKTTTTMCHLFGMTFALMLPLNCNYIIDTNKVLYPEDVNRENCILVSTPAFLSSLKKHNLNFCVRPKYIISAGAKLNDDVFEYFAKKSSIIEIYGSTETGIIAYRTDFEDKELTIFPNVKIEGNIICSNYIYDECTETTDNITINGNKLVIYNRKDNVLKIYDKRVSVDALKDKLCRNSLVFDAYFFKYNNKLACYCALSEDGKKCLIENGTLYLEKLLKKDLREISEVVPQKWKYCDEIPTKQTGKIDKEYINKLFSTRFSHPIILNTVKAHDKVDYTIFLSKNSNFYKGHFPEFPITPGVTQLYFANEIINHYFNINVTSGQIKRIKFMKLLLPNSVVHLTLKKEENIISYIYYDDTSTYSSGAFSLENIFTKEQKDELLHI